MKKYALISSVLAISMISNCMEKELTILTVDAQKKVDLVPKVTFSLTDEEIFNLRTVLTEKKKLDIEISQSEQGSILDGINNLENKRNNLTNQLDLVQRSPNFQLLKAITMEAQNQKLEMPILAPFKSTGQSIGSLFTKMIDTHACLYREIEAIQQFAENELRKNEIDELFMIIKDKCLQHIPNVIIDLNEGIRIYQEMCSAEAYITIQQYKQENRAHAKRKNSFY